MSTNVNIFEIFSKVSFFLSLLWSTYQWRALTPRCSQALAAGNDLGKTQGTGLYKSPRASGCSDDAAVKFRMREIWVILRHVQPKNQPPYHPPLSPASVL